MQGDVPNYQLHLIGFCESHSGAQGLRVKSLVSELSQAGNVKGTQRSVCTAGRDVAGDDRDARMMDGNIPESPREISIYEVCTSLIRQYHCPSLIGCMQTPLPVAPSCLSVLQDQGDESRAPDKVKHVVAAQAVKHVHDHKRVSP